MGYYNFFVDVLDEHEAVIFFVELRFIHLVVEKNMVLYLKGTIEYGRIYLRDQRIFLQGDDDFYWVDIATNRNSTPSCCRKRTSVALSENNDEYIEVEKKSREDYSSDGEYVLLSRIILPINTNIILLSISTLDNKGCICRTHIFNTNTKFYVIYGGRILD